MPYLFRIPFGMVIWPFIVTFIVLLSYFFSITLSPPLVKGHALDPNEIARIGSALSPVQFKRFLRRIPALVEKAGSEELILAFHAIQRTFVYGYEAAAREGAVWRIDEAFRTRSEKERNAMLRLIRHAFRPFFERMKPQTDTKTGYNTPMKDVVTGPQQIALRADDPSTENPEYLSRQLLTCMVTARCCLRNRKCCFRAS